MADFAGFELKYVGDRSSSNRFNIKLFLFYRTNYFKKRSFPRGFPYDLPIMMSSIDRMVR